MSRALLRGALALALVLLGSSAYAEGVPLSEATPAQVSAAQKTFQAANELYDAKRFDEAISAFRASHDIVASPNSSLMIARSLRELGRVAEAYDEYQLAASEADAAAAKDDKYAATAKACHDELDALASRVGKIRVRVSNAPPGTTLRVADKPADPSSGEPVVVAPGSVTVVASGGGRDVRRSVSVVAGQTEDVTLDLAPPSAPAPPPPPPPKPAPAPHHDKYRTLAYVAGGIGVAGLVGFGVLGAMNNAKFSQLQSDCPGGHCSPDRSSDIDTGKTYQTLANVGLVVGVLGIGGGVALFMLGSHGHEATAARAPRRAVLVGPGSISVVGDL